MPQALLKPPPGACDCHMHVYDERYMPIPGAPFKPPHAPASAYQAVQKELGLERVIVVQPAAYGYDNSCMLEAMAAFGSGSRGVVVVAPGTDDAELERLTRAGIRGIRYFMLKGGLLPWDTLEPMATRLHDFGWHINLQLDGRDLAQYEAVLKRLPGRLVIDHNGKFLEPVKPDHPGFQTLLRLLDTGRVWVKLAAPYETSKSGPPEYEDVGLLARALVKAHPERCIWASNWPQPNFPSPPSRHVTWKNSSSWATSRKCESGGGGRESSGHGPLALRHPRKLSRPAALKPTYAAAVRLAYSAATANGAAAASLTASAPVKQSPAPWVETARTACGSMNCGAPSPRC